MGISLRTAFSRLEVGFGPLTLQAEPRGGDLALPRGEARHVTPERASPDGVPCEAKYLAALVQGGGEAV